jgi:hypothetical protein
VNRVPDFVRYVVQRLKALCPGMGKVKIAETLARAGLHLGATTVRRTLKEKPLPTPSENDNPVIDKQGVGTAKYCGHVWHVDLTTLPTGASGPLGFRSRCLSAGPLHGGSPLSKIISRAA